MDGWFGNLQIAPAIEVFKLTEHFTEDTHAQKVNLGVGGKFFFQIMYDVSKITVSHDDRCVGHYVSVLLVQYAYFTNKNLHNLCNPGAGFMNKLKP